MIQSEIVATGGYVPNEIDALRAEVATLKANIAAVDASRDRMKARAEEAEQVSVVLLALVDRQTERACKFNCDAESLCTCPAHKARRAVLYR